MYEGGPGFVYLEAMGCGLPVIGCAGSGLTEIIKNEVNGLLVPPGDVDALVSALQRLLSNADLREAIGKEALNYVKKEADSETNLLRLESFYKSVINGGINHSKIR